MNRFIGTRKRPDPALIVVVVVTIVAALIRLARNPRFFFYDDTQLYALGQWHKMAQMLLGEGLSPISVEKWQAGNFVAEGQWGLLSPVHWLNALILLMFENQALGITVIKIATLALFAIGVYLLAKCLGANPWVAAAIGAAVPAAGFTVYMDATSWYSGLFNSAAFVFAWLGIELFLRRRNPVVFLFSAYLLVTFGYIFGVIVLMLLLTLYLGQQVWLRDYVAAIRVAIAVVFTALLSVTVFLPGVLTAPVTWRASGEIVRGKFLSLDGSDTASFLYPFTPTDMSSFHGEITYAPLIYVSVLLPALFLAPRSWLESSRKLFVPIGITIILILLVLGPTQAGPLRWPARLMPYVVVGLAAVAAIILSNNFRKHVSKAGLTLSLVWIFASGWIVFSEFPKSKVVTGTTVTLALMLVGFYFLIKNRNQRGGRFFDDYGPRLALGSAIVISLLVTIPQVIFFPSAPLRDFNVPVEKSALASVLPAKTGVLQLGDVAPVMSNPDVYNYALFANLWYYSSSEVQNAYTPVGFAAYSEELCMNHQGITCPDALGTLLKVDQTTGLQIGELLGVNTLVLMNNSFDGAEIPPLSGWTTLEVNEFTTVISRDNKTSPSGSVAWSSDGTNISEISNTDNLISFRVNSIGDSPRAVFKRLAWPGYSTNSGSIVEPTRDYLLTVDLGDVKPGEVVTVAYEPPAYPLLLISFALALVIGITWIVVFFRSGISRSSQSPSISGKPTYLLRE